MTTSSRGHWPGSALIGSAFGHPCRQGHRHCRKPRIPDSAAALRKTPSCDGWRQLGGGSIPCTVTGALPRERLVPAISGRSGCDPGVSATLKLTLGASATADRNGRTGDARTLLCGRLSSARSGLAEARKQGVQCEGQRSLGRLKRVEEATAPAISWSGAEFALLTGLPCLTRQAATTARLARAGPANYAHRFIRICRRHYVLAATPKPLFHR